MSIIWDHTSLQSPVLTWPAAPVASDHPAGLPALYIQGPDYRGKPTRAYAVMSMPAHAGPDKKVPGMVLIHGGGGSAFWQWVKLWNDRGYAAIAVDTCGATPGPEGLHGSTRPRHEYGGPPGWNASFEQNDEPIADQWAYHAVALATQARKLLAEHPGVDAGKIGVTGISWGGYLTCIIAGADPDFACAIPVYGSGFLWEDSIWKYNSMLADLPPHQRHKWISNWDPGSWLHKARSPMLFVNGTNDGAYFMNSMRKSWRATAADKSLCVRIEMPHSHTDGWAPIEIGLFADSHLKAGVPLPRVTSQTVDERRQLTVTYESALPITKAQFCYTRATGYWPDRKWNALSATIDAENRKVHAAIPRLTTGCFLNLIDERGALVSSEHVEVGEGY
jgi:dienelactone hydrolase